MILIAPTAFKETMAAPVVARAIAEGVRAAGLGPARVLPLSDGGHGLIDALLAACGGVEHVAEVSGPLAARAASEAGPPAEPFRGPSAQDRVRARWLRLDGLAVIETAEACGLHLVPPERRDPLVVHTRGVGELMHAVAATAPEAIVLGLGGSATVDGGAGMASALGWRLLDADGRPIPDGGGGLERLARIVEPTEPASLPPLVALADVRNPLLGPDGAAPVFGPQKGASPEAVARLERGLANLAAQWSERLHLDLAAVECGGAAGGLGAGVVAFLGAELAPGSRWILERVGFDTALEGARLVVTGEGEYDAQTGMGKVVGEVVERARAAGVPVLIVAGRVRARPPAGVVAVDGGGARLGPDDIARLVARHAPGMVRSTAHSSERSP